MTHSREIVEYGLIGPSGLIFDVTQDEDRADYGARIYNLKKVKRTCIVGEWEAVDE